MNTTTCTHLSDGLCPQPSRSPWYYSPRPSLVDGISDHHLALAAPIVAYWSLSLFFHYLDTRDWKSLQKYRIHDSSEVASRNRVSRSTVILAVIFQQIVQTALGLFWMDAETTAAVDHDAKTAEISRWFALVFGQQSFAPDSLSYFVYWWGIPSLQFLFAMYVASVRVLVRLNEQHPLSFIIDTWQYFLHRSMHINKFMYRHFHSWHHQLYVPYAFGALYNHPVEGFLLDSLGAVIAEALSGMSTRQAALLFSIATFKTVDDHCGYRIPFDPLQLLTSNNADYHDIHHQVRTLLYFLRILST